MSAETSIAALDTIVDDLEDIVDCTSFELQHSLHICDLQLLDVTPPIAPGDQREVLLFPYPRGFQTAKGTQSMQMGNVQAALLPSLTPLERTIDPKARAALRWYIKALSCGVDVDQFAFYWIALELVAARNSSPARFVYTAPCNHAIPNCPICGQSTERIVQGETLKSFLVQELSVDRGDAQLLWNTRQMFHGSNRLDRAALSELPRLLMVLRAAVTKGLKESLGLNAEALPTVAQTGPAISNVSLYGSRAITTDDLVFQ